MYHYAWPNTILIQYYAIKNYMDNQGGREVSDMYKLLNKSYKSKTIKQGEIGQKVQNFVLVVFERPLKW